MDDSLYDNLIVLREPRIGLPISIGSNIASLNVQRKLAETNSYAEKIYQRLSSGARINSASDDAAGLAIAQNLNTDTKVFTQAVRNGNDGLSVLSIAESVVASLSDIVIRIRELAEQSANGTYSNEQRQALDTEAQALSKEYFRVSRSAKFNGVNLFDGTIQNGLRFQLGYGVDGSLQSTLGGVMGSGTFGSSVSYTAEGGNTDAVEVADINGDGILDIITAGDSGGVGYATIRLGVGDGTFGAATSYQMHSSATNDVTMGDLNGDGILDLVAAGSSGGLATTSIRLGLGNGTFGDVSSFSLSMGASSAFNVVSLGDFNGDGILDAASGGVSAVGSGYEIRLGTGNGQFASTSDFFSSGSEAVSGIAIADLNGDNILDIAVAGGSRAGFLVTHLGSGDGTFATASTVTIGASAVRSLDLGDFNNDGILDFVLGSSTNIQTASGQGDGTFGTVTSFVNETSGSNQVLLADFNGDGSLDLVSAGASAGDGFISVRLGSGTGTFGTRISYAAETATTNGVTAGDLNGDGVLDIISAGRTDGATGAMSTFMGQTREGIAPILSFSLATKSQALQAMGMLERNQANLIKQQGVIGAFQSRLGVAINNLTSSRDNFSIAESRIRDADVAVEAAELARVKVLQNAAVAVLAQANQAPRIALDLLLNR